MKTGFKFMGMLLWLIILVGAGYTLVLMNLSVILDTGKTDCRVQWQSNRLVFKTGRWTEVVYLIPSFFTKKAETTGLRDKSGRLKFANGTKFELKSKKLPLQGGK